MCPVSSFKMRERTFFPEKWDFYGKLKVTKIADPVLKVFSQQRNIDPITILKKIKSILTQLFSN